MKGHRIEESKMSFVNYVIERLKKTKRMMNDLVEYDLNHIQKFIIYIDLGLCIFVYGLGITDYFQFKFYTRKRNFCKTFIVHRKRIIIIKKFNNPTNKKIFNTKSEFNKKYSKFIGRDWLLLQDSTINEFKYFVDKHPRFISKVVDGSHGKGIEVVDLNDRTETLEAI